MCIRDRPYVGDIKTVGEIVSSDAHQTTALRASRECLVLLKNDKKMLPLDTRYKRIEVIGPNARSQMCIRDRRMNIIITIAKIKKNF